jgi:PAS domain S-box-containing protein
MDSTSAIGLINNAALLLALGLLYDTACLRPRAAPQTLRQWYTGLVLGAIGMALMLNPLRLAPGAIFDTRSVLLSIVGLFFGALPATIAMAMTAALRIYQGGAGWWVGCSVILTSGTLGIVWRHLRRGEVESLAWRELWVFGVVVQTAMLLWQLGFPYPLNVEILRRISLPVMVIYPIGTALLGGLLVRRRRQNQAAEELRESESRYRSLFEGNHLPMMIVDPETGTILDVNSAAAAFYGWHREQLQEMKVSQINIASPETVRLNMAGAQAGIRNHFEFQHRIADGSIRDVEVFTGPISFKNQQVLYSIISDATERKQVLAQLREGEARFRNLVESAPIPIFIQTNSKFAYVNAAAIAAFGAQSSVQLLGMQVLDRFHPDCQQIVMERIRRLNQDRLAVPQAEEICFKLDGQAFDADVSAVPFVYEGQQGALVFFRDITDRKRAEQQRIQMERQILQTQKLESLGVLAGGIAHDFNNILMAVLGYADLALGEMPPMSPACENIREIEKASKRAAELCRQMLAYSGRGNFVIESIRLQNLIEEMVHLLKTSITKKAILNLHLEKGLPPMRGDATQIRQIIMNLVINASEAIGERSGVITISTGAMDCTREYLTETYLDNSLVEGLYIWLEVSDTGCGMDKETQNRMFEPFFTTKFTGRGLGMAAVMGIVRGHNGALKVYSELGRGTTFKVLFPALEDPAGTHSKSEPGSEALWKGSGLVLLVDDEETIRALGKKQLEALGFQVLVAADGREALEIYRDRVDAIRLVLLDLTMPHMNGEETFRELRRLNPTVRVVISSGYTESEIVSRFAGKGVADCVQKPYTLKTLRQHLRHALGEEA